MNRLALLMALLLGWSMPAFAQEAAEDQVVEESAQEDVEGSKFALWLEDLREEALNAGINEAVIDDAFASIEEPDIEVVEKDRSQPEMKKTFKQYVSNVFTQKKVKAARRAWKENKRILTRVSDTYNVQPQYLLALWGIESNFGEVQGNHSIIEALVTLAYDGRRSAFFRAQLLDALRIMQSEKIRTAELLGSWAGAMGQVQFMPSSFIKYAIDFSGDGKKDIWNNNADALASMANYLKEEGWDGDIGWGVAVSLPEESKVEWAEMKERLPLATWKKFGVRAKDGGILKGVKEEARLVLLDGDINSAYLVYPNFDVIMRWNRSTYFATTVGLMAEAIGDEE